MSEDPPNHPIQWTLATPRAGSPPGIRGDDTVPGTRSREPRRCCSKLITALLVAPFPRRNERATPHPAPSRSGLGPPGARTRGAETDRYRVGRPTPSRAAPSRHSTRARRRASRWPASGDSRRQSRREALRPSQAVAVSANDKLRARFAPDCRANAPSGPRARGGQKMLNFRA